MILKDKIVLITGAGGGIGRASAIAMAQAGAHVACADINEAAANETAKLVAEAGPVRVLALTVDVCEVAAIEQMIAAVVAEFGRLDVIVNAAAITRHAGILDITQDDWDRTYRVNVRGTFFCLQHAAQQMIKQGSGIIINLASIAGRGYIHTSNVAYASGKGAIISMTKTAAQQLGQYNINVNAICPGVTATPMIDQIFEKRAAERGVTVDEVRREIEATIPIGRVNRPEDIAAMAVFLASPAARNITAQAYNVDGGLVPS